MTRSTVVGVAVIVGAVALGVACHKQGADSRSPSAGAGAPEVAANAKYPEPRWPAYFKPPKSVEEIMPAARAVVRNRSGLQGNGMGVLNAGDSVLVVANIDDDAMVLEAIRRALQERKVTPHIKFGYELLGQTRPEALKLRGPVGFNVDKAGIYQASQFIVQQFARPEEPKEWLKARRPDVFTELFPDDTPEERQRQLTNKDNRLKMGDAIKAYFQAHPEIRGVFWGTGGTTGLRRQLFPMQEKYLGTFIFGNIYNLQSRMADYPGDLWQLAEEQQLEPIQYASAIQVDDPEGTHITAELTPDMADRWSQGAYQRGHLYMFPNQATGRFGYSFVNYPSFQGKWLAREPIALAEGVVAGTQGHGGFYPRMEIEFTKGYISDVRGGGPQGVALKEMLHYPALDTLKYPYHNKPGYWYLYECAFGSHPKGFRDPPTWLTTGFTTPERVRSGVIHWGLGSRLWHDPDAPTESKIWKDFTDKYNVPYDHGWHVHTYFTTYQVRLRNTDKWVKLLDRGRMTSLDDPEVRALASRYGDPDYLLSEDWTPEVPGINAPGDYLKGYAPDPGKYALMVLDQAQKGTYARYFPAAGMNTRIIGGKPAAAVSTEK